MIKYPIILLSFFLTSLSSKGQSINHIWLSEDSLNRLEFDSVSKTVSIACMYDNEYYKKIGFRFNYRIVDNKLKIIWYNNQTLLGNQKETFWLTIDELTNESLSLTFLPMKENHLVEIFGGYSVKFKKSDISCEQYTKQLPNR